MGLPDREFCVIDEKQRYLVCSGGFGAGQPQGGFQKPIGLMSYNRYYVNLYMYYIVLISLSSRYSIRIALHPSSTPAVRLFPSTGRTQARLEMHRPEPDHSTRWTRINSHPSPWRPHFQPPSFRCIRVAGSAARIAIGRPRMHYPRARRPRTVARYPLRGHSNGYDLVYLPGPKRGTLVFSPTAGAVNHA